MKRRKIKFYSALVIILILSIIALILRIQVLSNKMEEVSLLNKETVFVDLEKEGESMSKISGLVTKEYDQNDLVQKTNNEYYSLEVDFEDDTICADSKIMSYSEFFGEEKNDQEVKEFVESNLIGDIESSGGGIKVNNPYITKTITVQTDDISHMKSIEKAVAVVRIAKDVYTVKFDSIEDTKEGYNLIKNDKKTEEVAVDKIMEVSSSSVNSSKLQLDTLLDNCYISEDTELTGLDKYVYNLNKRENNRDIVVAVFDTGVTTSGVYFKTSNGEPRFVSEGAYDYFAMDSDPRGEDSHGTHVGGIITQATPNNVKILSIRVGNMQGIVMSAVLEAMADLKGKVDFINMSFGGYVYNSAEKSLYDSVYKEISEAGTILVAAAGNESQRTYGNLYPADSEYTISVAASYGIGKRTNFSNYGPKIDFTMPGSSVKSANYNYYNGYLLASGTSMASPYCVAALACLATDLNTMDKDVLYEKMKENCFNIEAEGEKGKTEGYGWGIINFNKTMFTEPVIIGFEQTADEEIVTSITADVICGYPISDYYLYHEEDENDYIDGISEKTMIYSKYSKSRITIGCIEKKGNYKLYLFGQNGKYAVQEFYKKNEDIDTKPPVLLNYGVTANTDGRYILHIQAKDNGLGGLASTFDYYLKDLRTGEIKNYQGILNRKTGYGDIDITEQLEPNRTYRTVATVYDTYGNKDIFPRIGECEFDVGEINNNTPKEPTLILDNSELEINKGETATIIARTENIEGDITWESDNTDIVVVENGLVRALEPGNATITAKIGELSETCDITVTNKYVEIYENGVKTNKLKILVGEERKLVALANDTVEMAEWESLTPDIVSVNEFGLVTGLSVGEGILKATADGKYYDICNVTVYEMTKEEQEFLNETVNILPENVSIAKGSKLNLEFEATGDVRWTSNDESIATVSATGKVTAISNGIAIIQAWCGNSFDTCVVGVEESRLLFDEVFYEMIIGEQMQFNMNTNSTETIIFTSENPEIVRVNKKGIATAVNVGTTKITASIADKTAVCDISVLGRLDSYEIPPEEPDDEITNQEITLSKEKITLTKGKYTYITATSKNMNDIVEWKSSNEYVAKIENNKMVGVTSVNSSDEDVENLYGKISAVGVGSAVITAYSRNGIEASCVVTVENSETKDENPNNPFTNGENDYDFSKDTYTHSKNSEYAIFTAYEPNLRVSDKVYQKLTITNKDFNTTLGKIKASISWLSDNGMIDDFDNMEVLTEGWELGGIEYYNNSIIFEATAVEEKNIEQIEFLITWTSKLDCNTTSEVSNISSCISCSCISRNSFNNESTDCLEGEFAFSRFYISRDIVNINNSMINKLKFVKNNLDFSNTIYAKLDENEMNKEFILKNISPIDNNKINLLNLKSNLIQTGSALSSTIAESTETTTDRIAVIGDLTGGGIDIGDVIELRLHILGISHNNCSIIFKDIADKISDVDFSNENDEEIGDIGDVYKMRRRILTGKWD